MKPTSKRVIADLKELAALTTDARGAQRVAWGPVWRTTREWFTAKLQRELGIEPHRDGAGNLWATLPGRSKRSIVLGSHLDSVPGGGWLDGCLGVLAGFEALRRAREQGKPPLTLHLVDWADEEGARFGRSLAGSAASAGTLDAKRSSPTWSTVRASSCPTRSPRTGSRSPAWAPPARTSTRSTPSPTSSSTSSRAPCSRR